MSNQDHLAKLLEGPQAWNAWRTQNPDIVPDFYGATLTASGGVPAHALSGGFDLRGAQMQGADIAMAVLTEADLTGACLEEADLGHADLSRTLLTDADLSSADLTGARLANADLSGADLARARLAGADLSLAVGLTNAQIRAAYCDLETLLPSYLDTADIDTDPDGEDLTGADAPAREAAKKQRTPSPYVILDTPPHASAMELRNAYLRLAKKYHPDVNPGDGQAEERFKDINEAYRRAAARSRLRDSANRQRRRRSRAAAIAFFAVGAAATGAGVYWMSTSSRVTPGIHAALEAVSPPKAVEIDDAGPADPALQNQGQLAAGTTAQLALAVADAKGGAAGGARPDPAPVQETASIIEEPHPHRLETAAAPQPVPVGDPPRTDSAGPALLQEPAPPAAPAAPDPAAGRQAANAAEPEVAKPAMLPVPAPAPPVSVPMPQRLTRVIESDRQEGELHAWQSTKAAGTIAAFRAYLINFPAGRHASEAREHLAILESEVAGEHSSDEAAWIKARRAGTRSALETYLGAFPRGRYVRDAKKKLAALDARIASLHKEEELWAKAKAENSREAYVSYLNAYPNGRYASQAQETIAAAEGRPAARPRRIDRAAQSAEDRQPRPPRFSTPDDPFGERLSGSY